MTTPYLHPRAEWVACLRIRKAATLNHEVQMLLLRSRHFSDIVKPQYTRLVKVRRAGTAGLVYTDTWSVSSAVSFPRGSCNPRLHRVAPQQRRLHDPAGNADHHGPASPAHAE